MKRATTAFICLLVIISIVSMCSGCQQSYWNNEEKIDIPRNLRFEYFYSKEFGTNTTATATAIDDTTGENQVINFYTPYRKSIDRFLKHPGWYPNSYYIDNNAPRYCYRIEILDIEFYTIQQSVQKPWKWPQTCYHVQVIRNESTGEEINKDAYIFDMDGSPQYYQYGYSRLAIGQEYLVVDAYLPYLTEWRNFQDDYAYRSPYLFEIHSIDGIEYLYSCKDDISSLEFKIEITDPTENQMYKDFKDWDIIHYLTEQNVDNPTFSYKVTLSEFIEYRNSYNKEWNSNFESEIDIDSIIKYASSISFGIPEEDKIFLNKRDLN